MFPILALLFLSTVQVDMSTSPQIPVGATPLSVTFTPIVAGAPESTTYSWDFGDGTTSSLKVPSHSYAVSGRFTVSVSVNTGSDTGICTKTNLVKTFTRAVEFSPYGKRSGFSSTITGGKMWIVGGRDEKGEYLNDVWASSNGSDWTCLTHGASWAKRADFYMNGILNDPVEDGDGLYLYGGHNDTGILGDVWFTTDGVAWTLLKSNDFSADGTLTGRFSPRFGTAVSLLPSKDMFLLGGRQSSGYVGEIRWGRVDFTGSVTWVPEQIFSILGITFSTYKYPLPFLTCGGGTMLVRGDVSDPLLAVPDLVVYGGGGTDIYSNGIWTSKKLYTYYLGILPYRVAVMEWTNAKNAEWEPRRDSRIAVKFKNNETDYKHPCQYWMSGGYGSNKYFSDLWESTDGLTWSKDVDAAPWGGRVNHGMLWFRDRLWALSGEGSQYHRDIWYYTPDPVGPVCNFSGTPNDTLGDSVTVAFSDLSKSGSYGITRRLWDFGDGNTSSSMAPTHVYTSTDPKYDVSLTVWTGSGSSTITKPEYVLVGSQKSLGTSQDRQVKVTKKYVDWDGNYVDADYPGLSVTWYTGAQYGTDGNERWFSSGSNAHFEAETILPEFPSFKSWYKVTDLGYVSDVSFTSTNPEVSVAASEDLNLYMCFDALHEEVDMQTGVLPATDAIVVTEAWTVGMGVRLRLGLLEFLWPYPLLQDTLYYVVYSSGGKIKLSKTLGGHPVNIVTTGTGNLGIMWSDQL